MVLSETLGRHTTGVSHRDPTSGYLLRHPSAGQQYGVENGKQPKPDGHGLLHTTVAGFSFGFAPQYSCQSSQRPSLLSGPQFPQLLQSHLR